MVSWKKQQQPNKFVLASIGWIPAFIISFQIFNTIRQCG